MRWYRRTLLLLGTAVTLGGCAADATEPASVGAVPAAASLTIPAEQLASLAAGVEDMQLRVLPTLGDQAASLRTAVAVIHTALERRDAAALARGIPQVLDGARVLAARHPDLGYELEPLALSLAQLGALLPPALRVASDDYTITR